MNLLVSLFSSTYEELWKAIIRPYRDEYTIKDLGPTKFRLNQKYYKRTDFSLMNNRNIRLKCSFWEPYDEEREYPRLPCVVYLHGNSSSRCEVVPNLKYLLPLNITVFAFDFAGCGHSEGEYISLGWYETLDVQCVINFLRKSNKVSTIGLWGRSMGAVTSIIYSSKDQSIGGIFLDSPFYSLNLLIDELSKEKVSLPNFLVKQVINKLKETVKEKGNFNIDDIETENFAKKCFVPAFFSHGKDDTFVNIHHCKDLYKVYPGEKNIFLIEGDHNSLRPNKLNEKASEFFYNCLKCKYIGEINNYYNGYKLIINEWNTINTPSGDKDNKIKVKNTNYRNYGDTVPVDDIEEPKINNIKKIVKKTHKISYEKISINSNNNICNNNYNGNNKKEKYKFRIYRDNKINSDDKKINSNYNSSNNNNEGYNIKNLEKNSDKEIYKEKVKYKKINKNSHHKYPSSTKDSYNYKTFSKTKTEERINNKNNNNNLIKSNSNYINYTSVGEQDHLNINNTQNTNNYNRSNTNTNQIYNNHNNISDYFSYNTNNYNSNNSNMSVMNKEIKLKKMQIRQNSQNKGLKPYTPFTSAKSNIEYLYPTPTLMNQSEIGNNSSYKNIKSMSPSYNFSYNQKIINNNSSYSYESNITFSNNFSYENNNSMSMNNYNLYSNSNEHINTSNYNYNY